MILDLRYVCNMASIKVEGNKKKNNALLLLSVWSEVNSKHSIPIDFLSWTGFVLAASPLAWFGMQMLGKKFPSSKHGREGGGKLIGIHWERRGGTDRLRLKQWITHTIRPDISKFSIRKMQDCRFFIPSTLKALPANCCGKNKDMTVWISARNSFLPFVLATVLAG